MKVIKYLLAGALMTASVAPSMAQDVKSQVNAITKVIADNKDNLKAVNDQIKDFVKENKKDPVALAGLGRAYLNVKDTANAKKYAEMAIQRGKNNAAGYVLLGDIDVFNNDGGSAATWYQQATVMDPQNEEGYKKYASIYRKRSPELAVQMLEKLRTIKPDYPVDAEAGHLFYLSGKNDRALEYYSKLTDVSKIDDERIKEYATAAYVLGKNDQSLQVCLAGLKMHPRNPVLNRLAFYNNLSLKNYKEAISYSEKLFNASDSAKFIHTDYTFAGHAYMGDSLYDKAIGFFEKAISENLKPEENADLMKQISNAYRDKEDWNNAILWFDKYLKNAPKTSALDFADLANIYRNEANKTTGEAQVEALKKADQVYADLLAKHPEEAEYAYFMRARMNAQLDPETTAGLAKPYYEKLAELVSQHAEKNQTDVARLSESYRYLGYYYLLKNDKATSDTYFKKVLEVDPENEVAKQALGIQ